MQAAQVARFVPHWTVRIATEVGRPKTASGFRKSLAPTHLHARISITSICLTILLAPRYIAVLARGVRARSSQSRLLVADLPDQPLH